MSRFLDALRARTLLADGALGSYIFELTGRLSEENHVYEALSVDHPQIIRDTYRAYLNSGSRCLTTNTFAANKSCLAALGMSHRTAELSAAAVTIAREAIDDFAPSSGASQDDFFVLGSVGPTHAGDESDDAVTEAYAAQLQALIDGGVDALLLESFRSIELLQGVLREVTRRSADLPVIAHMSLNRDDGSWNVTPEQLIELGAQQGARVVGINCCTPWDAAAFVATAASNPLVSAGDLLLSAMPNAGGFQHIGNRFMTRVNPEYMGQLARTLSESGASLLGGCCEIHPAHVWEMNNYLNSRGAWAPGVTLTDATRQERPSAGPDIKRDNGPFSRKLMDGEFAVSVEMLPSRGTAPNLLQAKIDFVRELTASGLSDALDITDGSRGIPLIPPGDFIQLIRQGLGWTADTGDGIELIAHFTARDLNVMGVQARLVGYWVNRIRNAIFITGDPPKMAPTYPPSTGVFDLDSVDMIRLAQTHLNAGVDFGGQPLGKQRNPGTGFTIGTGFEPEALDGNREFDKLQRKLDAGADYVMTQPAFRSQPLDVLTPVRDRVPVLIGVLILRGYEHARRMRDVPGVVVPDSVVQRLDAADDPQDQVRIGQDIAAEQIREIRSAGW
ncbi:MAG: hypothetical protein HOH74_05985, partial [Gemmatimonadetes bacterium]|nr:hypothetical protein [Gemmatimonadota bacterium]